MTDKALTKWFIAIAAVAAVLICTDSRAQVIAGTAVLGKFAYESAKQAELNSKGEKPTGDVVTANYRKGQMLHNFQEANDFCRAEFAKEHPEADHEKVHITMSRAFYAITCEMVAPKLEVKAD